MRKNYETTDVSAKAIVTTLICLFLFGIVTELSLTHYFDWLKIKYRTQFVPKELVALRVPPPAPKLQIRPEEDLRAYLERENHILKTYSWIDETHQHLRVPIERAIESLSRDR